jgi:hypothetical protein
MGMSRDEWINNDNWPTQIYVREARRMVGAYVIDSKDLITDRTKDDSVGVGSYNADSHHVQRVLKKMALWSTKVISKSLSIRMHDLIGV